MFRKILILAVLYTSLILQTFAFAQGAGKYVNVNGMKMYYEIHGQGTPNSLPLIVLHGAYMNIPSMGAIIPKLAKTHRVYALELQGHGRTTDIDRPITYPNLADDVAAFMDAVGLEQADVFGYSMGAIVGLQLAIRNPKKVNKLAAASGAYDVDGWQPEFKAFIPQMTVEMIVAMPFAEDYRKLAPNPDGFPALAAKLIALEKEPMAWEADVRALKTPVLIITADAEKISEDELLDKALEAGATDLRRVEKAFEITTAPAQMDAVRDALSAGGARILDFRIETEGLRVAVK